MKITLTALLTVTPWIVFAFLYYGNPIPHSVIAKLNIPLRLGEPIPLSERISQSFDWLIGSVGMQMRGQIASIEFAEFFFWAALLLTGVIFVLKKGIKTPLLPLVLYPFGFSAAMLLGGLQNPFPWYLVPSTWACVFLVALGALALLRRGLEATKGRRVLRISWALSSLLVVGVVTDRILEDHDSSLQRWKVTQEYSEAVNKAIGIWLKDNTDPRSTVAMEAIGYQGSYSDRTVIDLAGLVSPQVVRLAQESETHGELYYRVFSELRPEYLVLREFEITERQTFYGGPLFDDEFQERYFRDHYREVGRFSHPHEYERVSTVLLFARTENVEDSVLP